MDRRGPLLSLARRLEESSLAKNWRALERANADTSRIVADLHAQGPWSNEERAALEQLKQAHDRARARCAAALRGVSLQLAEVSSNREGWLAYAAVVAQAEDQAASEQAAGGKPKNKEEK